MRCVSAIALALGIGASSAFGAPITWSIDTPWDFYTASKPAQTNLVGWITFDSEVSNYYPVAWSFTLVHFDPIFDGYFPIEISSATNPSFSDASGVAWYFRRDVYTQLGISFGGNPAIVDVLLNGTQNSVTFSASEYVHATPSAASQRLIYSGTATLVPAPGVIGPIVGIAGLGAVRRRRR